MSHLGKYLNAMSELNEEASLTLHEIATELKTYDVPTDKHYQRVQEFNSTYFWLNKALSNGLPETILEFYTEVKGVFE